MSHNQSRVDKSEAQLKKPGRSGSSGHYRGFSGGGGGGKGGGGSAPSPPTSSYPSNPPLLSTNRSFKKSGNGQGGQSRVIPTYTISEPAAAASASATAVRTSQNGVHAQPPLHGASDAPVPSGAKPVDTSVPKNSRVLPRPPSSQTTAGSSDSAASATPAKGDPSKAFTLQFGSISPGFVNGMQIPARTSSAPPNLDEQKHDQARNDTFRAIPTLPISSAPKQQHQQPKKDMGVIPHYSAVDTHPPTQTRRETHAQIPVTPSTAGQKSPALPLPGMSMSMQFQQAQVPVQFGGPSPQMQSQSVPTSSLQIPMPLPVGSAQLVQQQMFVPSLQSHPLQPQGMMHQGQGISFPPQMSHQLATQLGIVGPQFSQQQTGKFGGARKTTVKITHPETHEELRLDKSFSDAGSSGQRPHPNVTPHSQPIPSFAPSHQMNYYPPLQPNSYSGAPMFLHNPTSLPLTSSQMTTGSQASRYNSPVSQSGPAVTYMNPSVHNHLPVSKAGPRLHSVADALNMEQSRDALPVTGSAGVVQVTVKPAAISSAEKVGVPSVTVSVPVSKDEVAKVVKSPLENASRHQQRGSDISSESSILQTKPVSEPSDTTLVSISEEMSAAVPSIALVQRTLTDASSSAPTSPIGDSGSTISITDGRRREPVRRSNSLKDQQKKPSKKDLRHSQQHHQADVPDFVDRSKLHPLKTSKESFSSDIISRKVSRNSEQVHTDPLASEPSTSTTNVASSNLEQDISSETRKSKTEEDQQIVASLDSSAGTLEEAPQGCFLNASEAATVSVPVRETDPFETSSSVGLQVDVIELKKSAAACPDQADHTSSEVELKPKIVGEMEYGNNEGSDNSSLDSNHVKIHPDVESSESLNLTEVTLQEGAATSELERAIDKESVNIENRLASTVEDAAKCTSKASNAVEEFVDTAPSSLLSSEEIHDVEGSTSDKSNIRMESMVTQEVVVTESEASSLETEYVQASVSSVTTVKSEGKFKEMLTEIPVSISLSGHKDRPSLEVTRAKTPSGKKKKKKDILSKADAAGTNSDLYMAYKGPAEKSETAISSESIDSSSTFDVRQASVDETEKKAAANEEDRQSKSELDDWEDAVDISTPKLRTSEIGQQGHGGHGSGTVVKKYSRDFLLTFSEQCTDLPVGFEIGDISDALMSIQVGISHLADHESFPSPGRIVDRPTGAIRDRRVVGIGDEDKWSKVPGSFPTGRDPRLEVGHGPAVVNFRPGHGINHGVLRNPRGQSNQYVGGILSGPMQSLNTQGGVTRTHSDADRWQRAPGIQRGLIPSPQTPQPVMHKAERKYEIGKVSDQEEAKQRQLKAILNKLTPQNFEKLFEQVKAVNIDNTLTLSGVISQIFDKALMEPTFCEMYANFCFHLASELPDFNEDNQKITFKRLLLNKCQEEFERGEREQAEANKVEEDGEVKQSAEEREEKRLQARRRMLGNIRLIGELYKKKMLTERIMHECIQKLLGQYENPDEEDVEALCKLMSTIGEMIDHPKAKEHMDAYFDRIFKMSTDQKLSSRVRFMLRDAIDLRKNRWQQRRKVEGPKKIDEVHRDAAQERQAQSSRLARGPGTGSSSRRAPPVDYGPRGSTFSPSPSSHQTGGLRNFQSQRYGMQDARMDGHPYESRSLLVPLPQRPVDDESITLGPQGGLARGMSIRGQPLMPNVPLADIPPSTGDPRRLPSGQNGYSSVPDWTPNNSKEETMPRNTSERFMGTPYDQSNAQERTPYPANRDTRIAERASDRILANTNSLGSMSLAGSQSASSEVKPPNEEHLRKKSISAIREFYSAKDEGEVAQCIKDLDSPSFYPSMVSWWVTDSFERKDFERGLLAKLLIYLNKSQNSLISQDQLIRGFESVLSNLEDAVNDAPKAAEFLGHIFAKVILENVIPFRDIGELIHVGGEEHGRLLEIGLASEVLGSILEVIKIEKGDNVLNEIRTSSKLRLEDFRPPNPMKLKKLDAFLKG